jgi:hypothetical protein
VSVFVKTRHAAKSSDDEVVKESRISQILAQLR